MAAQRIVDSGAAIHRVSMVRNPLHPKIATGVVALRHLIAKLQPSVVHGHSSVGGAFARAAAWGQRVPVVYTPNGVATNRAILMVEKALARRTDHLIAVSESEGALVLELGLTTEDRLIVIHNGIDLEPNGGRTFDLRADLGLPADVALVGTVARLARQKAPEEFRADLCGSASLPRGCALRPGRYGPPPTRGGCRRAQRPDRGPVPSDPVLAQGVGGH